MAKGGSGDVLSGVVAGLLALPHSTGTGGSKRMDQMLI